MKNNILKIFNILLKKNGNQNWWPIDKDYHYKNNSDPRFEVIVGAILTQNTSWSNVEQSLITLKNNNKLDINKIYNIDISDLRKLIRSSGFYNQKAERIKNIASYIHNNYDSNLNSFFNREIKDIRKELLSLNGIGPETADSILLYAGNKPIFVVDDYTKRICKRLSIETDISYNDIQKFFENNLRNKFSNKEIIKVYQEFHALIVVLCKKYCKKTPECQKCVINKYCFYE